MRNVGGVDLKGPSRVLMLRVCGVVAAAAMAAPAGAWGTSSPLAAWGDNYRYDLGAGYRDTGGDPAPVAVGGLSGVRSAVAAGATSYAVLTDGTIRAWGGGVKGQLGDGVNRASGESTPLANARFPVTVLEQNASGERHELAGVKQLAASYGSYVHALALVENGAHESQVLTWGASEYGERANGEYGFVGEGHSISPREVAVASSRLTHVVAIAAGGASSYAIKEEGGLRTVWAWGLDQYGQLGIGQAETQKCRGEGGELACVVYPTRVALPVLPAGVQVASIAAGRNAAYAVLSNGEVLSWGANEHGQLGNGATASSSTPGYVCSVGATAPCGRAARLQGITNVAGGSLAALALTQGHEAVGWGANAYGQLGGTSAGSPLCAKTFPACQLIPKSVNGLRHISALSEGAGFSLALTEEGTVYSFGLDANGQLGHGTIGPETCGANPCQRVPTVIAGLAPPAGISAGGAEAGEGHSLAWLQAGSAPPPVFTLTAGRAMLTITWALSAEEFRLIYRLAPETGRTEGWSEPIRFTGASCSASSPCARTITGLRSQQQYEVRLSRYHMVEGVRKLEDSHFAIATPG